MAKKQIKYNSLHWWIRRQYGSAKKCENKNCDNTSEVFEWSLKKGRMYNKNIKNYWQLCRKCHFNYDMTSEYRKKFLIEGQKRGSEARMGTHHSKESKRKISLALKGRKVWNKGKKWSKEIKLKMSSSHKGKIPWNKGLKFI